MHLPNVKVETLYLICFIKTISNHTKYDKPFIQLGKQMVWM